MLQRHLIGVIIKSIQFWYQLNSNLNNIFKESLRFYKNNL